MSVTVMKVLAQWSIEIDLLAQIHKKAQERGMKDAELAAELIKLGAEV